MLIYILLWSLLIRYFNTISTSPILPYHYKGCLKSPSFPPTLNLEINPMAEWTGWDKSSHQQRKERREFLLMKKSIDKFLFTTQQHIAIIEIPSTPQQSLIINWLNSHKEPILWARTNSSFTLNSIFILFYIILVNF